MVTFVGIDLAASVHNNTGVAAIQDGKVIEAKIIQTEKEILDFVQKHKPNLIAVDAPLSFPQEGAYRQAEKLLRILGMQTFPLKGMKAMELLVKRAMRLAKTLHESGFTIIETFPSPLRNHFKITTKNPHIRDAIICANVAALHLKGKTLAYGDKKEGQIIMPLH